MDVHGKTPIYESHQLMRQMRIRNDILCEGCYRHKQADRPVTEPVVL